MAHSLTDKMQSKMKHFTPAHLSVYWALSGYPLDVLRMSIWTDKFQYAYI